MIFVYACLVWEQFVDVCGIPPVNYCKRQDFLKMVTLLELLLHIKSARKPSDKKEHFDLAK